MQPLVGASAIILGAWKNVKRNSLLYAEFVVWFILISLTEWFFTRLTASLVVDQMARSIALTLISLPFFLVYATLVAAMTEATAQAISSGKASFKESFFHGIHRLIPFLITSGIAGIAILGGTVLFVIPGIILLVSLSFAATFAVVDEKRSFASLIASRRLVAGRWWSTATRLVLPIVFFLLAGSILTSALQFLAGALAGDPKLFFGGTVVPAQFATTYSIVLLLITRVSNGVIVPLLRSSEIILWNDLKRTRPEKHD